ncbi:MAG TPA: hypothetical protein VGK30_08435 [Candidatus Binatia bacterium]|jgi:hypothetical protein
MPQTQRRSTPSETLNLSPDRAFVVEFGDAKVTRADHLSGRVEHVISGQAARFTSAGELLEFVHGVLRLRTPARKTRAAAKSR